MKKETSQLTEKLLREKEKNMKLLQNLANRAKERPTTNSSTIALMVRREKKEEGLGKLLSVPKSFVCCVVRVAESLCGT